MDKDIPEDSPIVFEKAIKNQTPQCWGRRGTSAAGRGAVLLKCSKALCKSEREEGFASSTQLQLPSTALQVKGRAARLGLALSWSSCKFSHVRGVSIKIHPLLLMSTCLFFPLMKLEIQADTLFHLPEPAGFICLFNSPVDSKLGWRQGSW